MQNQLAELLDLARISETAEDPLREAVDYPPMPDASSKI
jgi:hypothetical protein